MTVVIGREKVVKYAKTATAPRTVKSIENTTMVLNLARGSGDSSVIEYRSNSSLIDFLKAVYDTTFRRLFRGVYVYRLRRRGLNAKRPQFTLINLSRRLTPITQNQSRKSGLDWIALFIESDPRY